MIDLPAGLSLKDRPNPLRKSPLFKVNSSVQSSKSDELSIIISVLFGSFFSSSINFSTFMSVKLGLALIWLDSLFKHAIPRNEYNRGTLG